jgi:hypothetical protein
MQAGQLTPSWTMLRVSLLFCVALPLGCIEPGEVVGGVVGLALSPSPGAPAQRVARGGPALVLAVRGGWVRLLAADGSYGWTSRPLGEAFAARVRPGGALELSDRSPDQPSISEGFDTLRVPAAQAEIIGASEKARVAAPGQLMLPPRMNPFLLPWLEIRSGARSGWIYPPELPLEWNGPEGRDDVPAAIHRLGLEGIVRPPFLGAVKVFQPGRLGLEFEDIAREPSRSPSRPFTAKAVETLVAIPSQWIAVLSGSGGSVFVFSDAGPAVLTSGKQVVLRAERADLNGDGRPELVMELAETYGDGYTTALWIASGAQVQPVPLGGASGEPGGGAVEASWWLEASTLWIARANGRHVEHVRVGYGAAAGGPKREAAIAVIAARFPTREVASVQAIALDAQPFPLVSPKGPVEWAAGRLFRSRREAEAWRRAKSLPAAAVRMISASVVSVPAPTVVRRN